MRLGFGCLAIILGTVSVLLAGRYGYKGAIAASELDAWISATVFGSIALCPLVLDAVAVRLWFRDHKNGAAFLGVIGAVGMIVTFGNSLAALSERADTLQAARSRSKDNASADRAELKRIVAERGKLAATLTAPADDQAVDAARNAVVAAETIRQRECRDGDPKQRGLRCRERESEEQGKRDALAAVIANKGLTERLGKLDTDAATLRARLDQVPPVLQANPLAAALETMLGAGAAGIANWQQAVIAGAFELFLVGLMVGFELLGVEHPQSGESRDDASERPQQNAAQSASTMSSRRPSRAVKPTKSAPKPKPMTGSVKAFLADEVASSPGGRTEVKVLLHAYRAWCKDGGKQALELAEFVRAIHRDTDVTLEPGKDGRAYALDVVLRSAMAEASDTRQAAMN